MKIVIKTYIRPLSPDEKKAIDDLNEDLWFYQDGTLVDFDMTNIFADSETNIAFSGIEEEFARRATDEGVAGKYKLERSGSYPVFTYVRRRV